MLGWPHPPLLRVSLAIYAIALVTRLVLAFGFGFQDTHRSEPVKIALSLANRGVFGDPYIIPTGPTAHSAPVFPLALAGIYRIWGDSRQADLARAALSIAVASAEYALLPDAAVALGLGAWPGVLAGFAGALVPMQFSAEGTGNFEAPWVAVFLLLATARFARFLRSPALTAESAVRAGLGWGFGLLLSPAVLPVLGGFAILALAHSQRRRRLRLMRWGLVCGVVTVLVLAPWTVRNYLRFGSLFLIRDNLGLELFHSNNDQATPDLLVNIPKPFFQDHHPFLSRAAAERLRAEGEAAFEHEQLRAAMAWIRSNAGKFFALTMGRIRNFWFPDLPWRSRLAVWATTIAGLCGLYLLARRERRAAAVLAVPLIAYPLVYYLVENLIRYLHPLHWELLLLAGWMGCWLISGRLAQPAAVRKPLCMDV